MTDFHDPNRMIRLDLTDRECTWLHMMCTYVAMEDEAHTRDRVIMRISVKEAQDLHGKIYGFRRGYADVLPAGDAK